MAQSTEYLTFMYKIIHVIESGHESTDMILNHNQITAIQDICKACYKQGLIEGRQSQMKFDDLKLKSVMNSYSINN